MKKLPILMTLFLLCSSLFPASFLAADTEKDNNTQEATASSEYNEFGIKKGTMLFGEDISKLSEEELQYIPEGWRDGVVEGDLHDHASEEAHSDAPAKAPAGSMSRAAAYQKVNDYIASKKFTPAKTETNYKSVFPKMNYRGGYGKVEGVVAHETANDSSTITGEISYMTNNYQNAFVHAFVDHQRVIEIHPTNNSVWGAGRYGNQRFVQVELVRVHTFDNFARSIDNYSTYIASVLFKYKLGVSSAVKTGTKDGKGTLWSHDDVSKILTGTTHSDPHGYFAKYGYTWSEFVALVKTKYTKMAGNSGVTPVASAKEVSTSKLGHLKSSSAKIYSSLNSTTSKTAGVDKTNTVYYIKKDATVGTTKYYKISTKPSATDGVLGWVKGTDMSVQSHSTIDKKAKTFYIKGTGSAYKKAWGGSEDYFFKSLVASTGAEFKVNLTEKVGTTTWYRGVANDRTIWIEAKNVTAYKEKATSKLGHIKSSSVKIYPDLDKLSSTITAGTTYTNSVYYIKKEAVLNGATYYLLSKNPSSTTGVVGWVKATDASVQTHATVDKKAKTFYVAGTGSAYTKAWGGSKDYYFQKLVVSANNEFKVNLTEKVGSTVWYRGVLSGKTVWIEEKDVSSFQKKATSKLGQIKNGSAKIYQDLNKLSSTFSAGTTYTNATYYIKQETVLNGINYLLLSEKPSSTSGLIGWVKTTDVNAQTHVTVDKKAKTLFVIGSGKAYTKAWGTSKDTEYNSLSTYKNQVFNINLTEKVGSTVWYRGVLGGKTVWIEAQYLTGKAAALKTSSTSKLGHIKNSNVNIYPNINDIGTSVSAGTTYTNSVYYIKKEAVLNGSSYFLLSKKPSSTTDLVGWAKASDIDAQTHSSLNKIAKTLYIKGSGKAYKHAWGGSKDAIFSDLATSTDKEFKVNLTEKVGSKIWHRGNLNGKTVWIESVNVSEAKPSTISNLSQIKNDKVKIYSDIDNQATSILAGDKYINAVYFVKKQAVLNGTTYYLLSEKPSSKTGIIGWVKSSDTTSYVHKTVDKKAKTMYIKGNGSSFSKAWGGSKDYVYKSLSGYSNQTFKVNLTEKVGNNTWYRGTLSGKSMWINESYLKDKK